ncbi:MAG TPA: hypothetical protein VMT30_04520 [Candidatus Saccharimonadia bacterium]|nr:hypothetical protein [Candidatus Saccharimonadia bacterium]
MANTNRPSINRQIIAKAVFAISLVAVTATVGVVGFAQADRSTTPVAARDGYGGIAEQIRAAVDALNQALAAANDKFQTDIQKCVDDHLGGQSTVVSNFRSSSTSAIGDLSAKAASPAALSSDAKLDTTFKAANAQLQSRLDGDEALMVAQATASGRLSNQNTFRACIRTARNTYRDAINDALRTFRKAIHDILHP